MTGSFFTRLGRFSGDKTEYKPTIPTQPTSLTAPKSTKPWLKPYPTHIGWRLLEWLFLSFDLFYISDLLVWISRLIKPNTRKLSEGELELAERIYGNSIDYKSIRIDNRAFIGPMTLKFAYVGLGVIHSWGPMRASTFIHELVHVWQYQQVGAVYIPRALYAQGSKMGYNYGGIAMLEQALAEGRHFMDFNYEQQGDIVADYFCLRSGERPSFCDPNPDYIPIFERILGTVGIVQA